MLKAQTTTFCCHAAYEEGVFWEGCMICYFTQNIFQSSWWIHLPCHHTAIIPIIWSLCDLGPGSPRAMVRRMNSNAQLQLQRPHARRRIGEAKTSKRDAGDEWRAHRSSSFLGISTVLQDQLRPPCNTHVALKCRDAPELASLQLSSPIITFVDSFINLSSPIPPPKCSL